MAGVPLPPARAQQVIDYCILIRYYGGDALDKVRDGFSKDQLGSLDLTLESVKEEVRGAETVVTFKAQSADGPVTFWARVSDSRVVLFGSYSSEGRNLRVYNTGNEGDLASYFFFKLVVMPAEHMFFPSEKVVFKNSANPCNEYAFPKLIGRRLF